MQQSWLPIESVDEQPQQGRLADRCQMCVVDMANKLKLKLDNSVKTVADELTHDILVDLSRALQDAVTSVDFEQPATQFPHLQDGQQCEAKSEVGTMSTMSTSTIINPARTARQDCEPQSSFELFNHRRNWSISSSGKSHTASTYSHKKPVPDEPAIPIMVLPSGVQVRQDESSSAYVDRDNLEGQDHMISTSASHV